MKAVIAFLPCWVLYLLGDLASYALRIEPWECWAGFWYPIYNRLMLWSSAVQDWAGGGRLFPWLPAEPWPDDSEAA